MPARSTRPASRRRAGRTTKNSWKASDALLGSAGLSRLLFPIPTTSSNLQSLALSLKASGTEHTLAQLDPDGLNLGDAMPQIDDQTGGGVSLLTTSTFMVGTTAGGIAFDFIRNLSDPVQNAALPAKVQGSWGSIVYEAYGFYTSYNGAVAAWAVLAGGG